MQLIDNNERNDNSRVARLDRLARHRVNEQSEGDQQEKVIENRSSFTSQGAPTIDNPETDETQRVQNKRTQKFSFSQQHRHLPAITFERMAPRIITIESVRVPNRIRH